MLLLYLMLMLMVHVFFRANVDSVVDVFEPATHAVDGAHVLVYKAAAIASVAVVDTCVVGPLTKVVIYVHEYRAQNLAKGFKQQFNGTMWRMSTPCHSC